MRFSINDFFSNCDQIQSFLRIWSHLLKKSFMENFLCSGISSSLHRRASNSQPSFSKLTQVFQTLGRALENLRENQKLSREFQKLDRRFEQPPRVCVTTRHMLSQSATVQKLQKRQYQSKIKTARKISHRFLILFNLYQIPQVKQRSSLYNRK